MYGSIRLHGTRGRTRLCLGCGRTSSCYRCWDTLGGMGFRRCGLCGRGIGCAVVLDRLHFLRCRNGWPLRRASFCRSGLCLRDRNTGCPTCGTALFLRCRNGRSLGRPGFCLDRLRLCHRRILDSGRCVTNVLLDCMVLPLCRLLFGLYGGLLGAAGSRCIDPGMLLRTGFLRCRCSLSYIRRSGRSLGRTLLCLDSRLRVRHRLRSNGMRLLSSLADSLNSSTLHHSLRMICLYGRRTLLPISRTGLRRMACISLSLLSRRNIGLVMLHDTRALSLLLGVTATNRWRSACGTGGGGLYRLASCGAVWNSAFLGNRWRHGCHSCLFREPRGIAHGLYRLRCCVFLRGRVVELSAIAGGIVRVLCGLRLHPISLAGSILLNVSGSAGSNGGLR